MSIDWIMFLNKKFKSFGNVVVIALQSVFHLEIYQNYIFFLFLFDKITIVFYLNTQRY